MATTSTAPLSTNANVATRGCIATVSVTTPSSTNTINFILGEGQATPWLEQSVLGLKEGATTRTLSPDFQYADIHLHQVSLPTDDLPPAPSRDQYLSRAKHLLTAANENFKKRKGNYKDTRASIVDYNRALDIVLKVSGEKDLALRLYNNLALCYFRARDWTTCTAMCDAALELDESCAKAYYRRGLAAEELDQVVRAVADMREAIRLAPDDKLVQRECRRIEADAQEVTHARRNQFAEVYSRKPNSIAFTNLIPN